MRRIAAWLFLLTVLMGTFGTGAAWLIAWQAARREARARLKASVPAAERVVVRLTTAELAAARVDDHEVRLAGRMFDILQQTPEGQRIRLELLPDYAEDALFAHLDDLIAQLMAQGKGRQAGKLMLGIGTCLLLSMHWQPAAGAPASSVQVMISDAAACAGWRRIDAPPPQA